jgi:hypothetical protein
MSCSSSTSPEVGSLSGRVELVNDTGDPLLDPIDFSGVTVALYPLAELDTTIVRINREYPNVGVQISQETEFDHRNAQPVKSVIASTDGTFKIEDIPVGRYNVLLSKSGWGLHCAYNFSISKGENTLLDRIPNKANPQPNKIYRNENVLTLYPVKVLSGTIVGDYRFKRDKSYLINDNLTISGNLIIENGSRVNVATNKNLTVTGNLSSEDNGNGEFSLITSNSAIGELSNRYNEIQVFGDVDLRKCIIENSTNGLRVNNSSSVVTDCIVRNSTAGITFNQGTSVVVDRCIAMNIRENIDGLFTSYAGFYTIGCQSVNIKNSIVLNNSSGVKVKDLCYGQVSNCYFSRNRYASESYASETRIHHNVFDSSDRYDIRVCGHQLIPTIDYNLITSKMGIMVGFDLGATYTNCQPVIHNNNILSQEVFLYLIAWNLFDVDATMNYFGTVDIPLIQSKILDREDYQYLGHPNMIIESTGYFNINPIKATRVSNAGISH